jgi:phosphonate transport system substrate-binding protein
MRPLLLLLLACLLLFAFPSRAAKPLRIGLTPTFLNERHALIAQWQEYLENRLGRPVEFVLKDSYQETIELLHQRQLQVAWLCDCPHLTHNAEFQMVATPVFRGRPYYRAYLVVPESDTHTRSLQDLKDKVFAFSDPYSNVGYMSPRRELKQYGADPDHFFRRTFFTRSHRKSIEAVAVGVADAASVSSYIWETLHQQGPALTGQTRVAAKSREYGFPPLVADHTVDAREVAGLRDALLAMSGDPRGRDLLKNMNLDGFIFPSPEYYRPSRLLPREMETPQ